MPWHSSGYPDYSTGIAHSDGMSEPSSVDDFGDDAHLLPPDAVASQKEEYGASIRIMLQIC